MRVLASVAPSREQLPIVLNDKPGVAVIRGAAGSGKTTTAVLRLKQLCASRRARRLRLGLTAPVRVLLLTFNRSLAGYVEALADEQVAPGADLDLRVSTFASWAQNLHPMDIMSDTDLRLRIAPLASRFGLSTDFVVSEVDYALGRFPEKDLDDYVGRARDGRGTVPRVDKPKFLAEVIRPYIAGKRTDGVNDWHDLAAKVISGTTEAYDVILVDEAQDFTANQLRAVVASTGPETSLTFVLDTIQRIYPRYYTWREAGLDASHFVLNSMLKENLRNTRQIAAFARPLVDGLEVDDNGQLPDFESAQSDGPLPTLFGGPFSEQTEEIIRFIRRTDLSAESVGILHPKGHGWFEYLRGCLRAAKIDFVDLEQNRAWPAGPVNVGLSTLHSAKGLEFDRVVVCGLSAETAKGGASDDDSDDQNLRRLLAMGFGRAKRDLLVCYDAAKPPAILGRLETGTYARLGDPS